MGKRRRAGQLNDGLVCRGWLECVRVLLLLQTFLALCVAFLHLSAEFLPLSLLMILIVLKELRYQFISCYFFLHTCRGFKRSPNPKKNQIHPQLRQ